MPPKTTPPDLPQGAHIPVGPPPGGGSWTWSAEQAAWVPLTAPTQTNPHTESPQE